MVQDGGVDYVLCWIVGATEMKKLPWFWASMDKEAVATVEIWSRKPMLGERGSYWPRNISNDSGVMSLHLFRRITGIDIKPGECKRVRLPAPLEVE